MFKSSLSFFFATICLATMIFTTTISAVEPAANTGILDGYVMTIVQNTSPAYNATSAPYGQGQTLYHPNVDFIVQVKIKSISYPNPNAANKIKQTAGEIVELVFDRATVFTSDKSMDREYSAMLTAIATGQRVWFRIAADKVNTDPAASILVYEANICAN